MISSNLETIDQKLDHLIGLCEQLVEATKEPPPHRLEDEYLNFQEIAIRAGVTPAAVTNWRIRHDDFPKPAKEIGKTKLFSARQVSAWLGARQARQPKAVTQMQHS